MTARRLLPHAPLAAATVVYLVYLHRLFSFTPDDTFIFLRFARNWASGLGPVYNPGEFVQGFTSPLWVAWLTVVTHLSSDPLLAAKLTSAGLGLGLVVITHLIAREVRPTTLAPLAGLWLVGFIDVPYWAASGMDTMLFAVAVNAALYAYLRSWRSPRSILAAASCLAIAGLARPEGAFFAVLVAAFEWSRCRGRPSLIFTWSMTAAVGVILSQFAWSLVEFHALLPNTYYAKHLPPVVALRDGVRYFRDFLHSSSGAFVLLLSCFAFLDVHRRQATRLLGLVCLAFGVYILWVGGDTWAWLGTQRFMIVLLPALAVLMDLGVGVLADAILPVLLTPRARALGACAGLATAGAFLNPSGIGARAVGVVGGDFVMAQYLKAVAHPGETLVASDIGQFGYYTDMRVVDTYGLVTPFVARQLHKAAVNRYTMESTARLVDWVFTLKPRFVILKGTMLDGRPQIADECGGPELVADPRFAQSYRLLRVARERPYLLYIRNGLAPGEP